MEIKEPIIICGHRNPDTDSVCSAYSLARYKELEHGQGQYKAVRCGPLNPQTRYIFERLKLEPPPIMLDLFMRAHDILRRQVLSPEMAVFDAINLLLSSGQRILPVAGAQGEYLGCFSFNRITHFLIDNNTDDFFLHRVSISNFVKLTNAQVVHRGEQNDVEVRLAVASMADNSVESLLANLKPEEFFLLMGDRPGLLEKVTALNVGGVILMSDAFKNEELPALPKSYKGWILRTNLHTEAVLRQLRMSTPIKHLLETDLAFIEDDLPLSEIRERLEKQSVMPVLSEDKKILGFVSRNDLVNLKRRQLVLVDHNESGQAIPGNEEADIIEIVDHHRLAPRPTTTPIAFTAAPVGSTCTLVGEMFLRSGHQIPLDAAQVILSGIVADTVILRSPTTTDRDRLVVQKLSEITGFNPEELGADIYSNGSMLRNTPLENIVTTDLKRFSHNGVDFIVSQVEVVRFEEIIPAHQDALVKVLTEMCQKERVQWALLLVTNIHHGNSILLCSEYKRGQSKLSYPKRDDNSFYLMGVMSRKKQLLPAIIEALS